MKNLIGQRFGMLTVLDRESKNNHVVWICRCDCGNMKKARTASLVSGETRHCGCQTGKNISKAKLHNLVGKRFGKLTVIQRLDNHTTSGGQTKVMYLCRCDCGNERKVQAGKLTSGLVVQCVKCHEAHYDDLTGKRFGMLTVLNRVDGDGKRTFWKCQCDCGNIVIRNHALLKHSKCKIPNCGCLNGRKVEKGHTFIHHMTNTRIYNAYKRMKARCYNKNNPDYKDYGERNICICKEWLGKNGFENFYKWSMKNGYSEKLSIDRIDVNGNYEPTNCRWADDVMQANNKRNNKIISYNGREQTIAQWAREYGMNYSMLYSRISRGWSVKDALETPNLGRNGI